MSCASLHAQHMLNKCLKKITGVVDLSVIKAGRKRQSDAWCFGPVDYPPLTINFPSPPPSHLFKYREIFEDMAKMLTFQLETNVYPHCLVKDDSVPSVRADYGVVIIPSAFGCKIHVPDDAMPWVAEEIFSSGNPNPERLGEPSFDKGLPNRVIETEEYFMSRLDGTGIRVYLADTQGPFNLAHEIMKERLFVSIYRYPDALKEVLSKMADAYVEFTKIQKEAIGEPLDQGAHGWDKQDGPSGIWMESGGVRLCDDSAVMVSPKHYEEFCMPLNKECFEPFEGGMWHSCGDTNHILPNVIATSGVQAINLGDPKMHSFRKIRDLTYKNKVCLIWKDRLSSETTIEEFVMNFARMIGEEQTGIIFSIDADNLEEAKELLSVWRRIFLEQ